MSKEPLEEQPSAVRLRGQVKVLDRMELGLKSTDAALRDLFDGVGRLSLPPLARVDDNIAISKARGWGG